MIVAIVVGNRSCSSSRSCSCSVVVYLLQVAIVSIVQVIHFNSKVFEEPRSGSHTSIIYIHISLTKHLETSAQRLTASIDDDDWQ